MSPGQCTEFSPSRSWSARILTLCVFLSAAAAVLYLPYLFPLKPTNSFSYVFGYNNRAALLLVGAFAVIGALWSQGRLVKVDRPAHDSSRIPRADLVWATAITLLLCVVTLALVGRLGGYVESGYDIYRLYLVSLGKHPYRDFEWPFGVALLYIPLWVSRLFHIGQLAAFYAVWVVASLLSNVALYDVVNRLRYPAGAARRWIFWILYVVFLGAPLGLGLHYLALRYLIPVLALLIIADWSRPERARVTAAFVLLLAATATMLLTSPEMAVAILVAATVLLWPRNRFTRSVFSWPAYLASLLATTALVLLATRLGVFDTARASGGGADSLPLMLSATALLFLLNVAIGFSALVWRLRHPDPEDNTPVVIIGAIPLLPAALGRADSGHLFANGLGFVVAAIVYLWPHRPRYAWLTLFAAAYVFPLAIGMPLGFGTELRFASLLAESRAAQPGHQPDAFLRIIDWGTAHLPSRALRRKEEQRLEDARRYPIGESYDFAKMYPGVPLEWNDVVLEAPYGFNPSHSNAMYRSLHVDLGFYQGDENANTPAAVQRKISELAAHPERPVLMPDHAEDGVPPIDGRIEQNALSALAEFPYRARPKHLESIYAPLYDYLRAHYRLAAEPSAVDYQYELWLPM